METPERFSQIDTRWSVLKGPARDALDYLYRVYGNATLSYLRRRLGRRDFAPLNGDDAEDIFQDFFLRLGETEWLDKPDPVRGRFRPYFIHGLIYFLRERRAAAAKRNRMVQADLLPEATAPDPAEERLEREWKLATVEETLRRIENRNEDWHAVLRADLERDTRTDAQLAAAMGRSLESFRSLLKRGRAAFRELYPTVERRLDGFGGGSF